MSFPPQTGEEVLNGEREGEENEDVSEGEYDREYAVEKILDEMLADDGRIYYKIRWEGYSPKWDSWEPREGNIEKCIGILKAWEATKAAQAKQGNRLSKVGANRITDRKRVTGGDESGSGSGRNKKRSKSELFSSASKRRKTIADVDDDSDDSRGTNDSFMNELREKNEGTFDWIKDVGRGKFDDDLDSDIVSLTSLTDQERKRRKSLKEHNSLSLPRTKIKQSGIVADERPPIRPSSSSFGPSKVPHFPLSFGKNRSLNAIKPAKRKPGPTESAVRSDERRQPIPKTISQINNIKKKQRQEPPPDPSQIAVFRPDSVLTSAGRLMRAGVGFDKAVGDVETAISLARKIDIPPFVQRKEEMTQKSIASVHSGRRTSVTEALAKAGKIREEAGSQTQGPKLSPALAKIPSPEQVDHSMEAVHTTPPANAQLNPPVYPTLPRRNSLSSADLSPPTRPPPPRRNSTALLRSSSDPAVESGFEPQLIDVMPTVSQDSSRTWTGKLFYSKDLASFGIIRLLIPESSIRIPNLPKFSGSSVCLQKLVSIQYLSERWLSATAHPSKKPDCLIAEFADQGRCDALVYLLETSSSAALVIEETFTLIFFVRHNDRLRNLFNLDSSNNKIGVALLDPLEKLDQSIGEPSHADEVRSTDLNFSDFKLLSERRLPYSSILSYDTLDSYVKDKEHHQFTQLQKGGYSYFLCSPPASLETDEMEAFLYSRGGYPALDPAKPQVVLINRLYQSCLNYIPHLTALKRRQICWPRKGKPKSQDENQNKSQFQEVEIYLFGSYLDYHTEGDTIEPVFGCGLTRIFPGGGILCFTIDYLLEFPQHIKSIIAYNVIPSFRVY